MERLFKTVQDRLVKELRLADVSPLEAANQVLESYLPIYNRRLAVQPCRPRICIAPRPTHQELNHILCLKPTRCLRHDWTIAHHGQLYQVGNNVRATHVIVEDRVDGTMWMTCNSRPLTYQAIVAHPLRVPPPPKIARQQRTVTPTRDPHAAAPSHNPDISTVA